MPATTHGRYRLGSATRTSSTRCAITNSRRTASRISGGTEPRPYSRSPAGGTGAPIWGPICRQISPELQLLQALAVQFRGPARRDPPNPPVDANVLLQELPQP